ncbi:MAG: hypothetical protein HY835_02855 [Anaerolineae bacterium]|nr:hypothetical protein [Anaerolineae bacterium]
MTQRITFSISPLSLVAVGTATLMLLAGMTLFDALRFWQCSSWSALPPLNVPAGELLGSYNQRLFVLGADQTLYCLKDGAWQRCVKPAFDYAVHPAPDWVRERTTLAGTRQLVRAGSLLQPVYLALDGNGQVLSCPTTFDSEVRRVARTPEALLLLIPLIIGVVCVGWFFALFIEDGSPTWWDVGGRGTKIK